MNLNGFEQNIPSTVFFYTISYWCCSSGTKVSSNIMLRDFHLKQRLPHINTRQISNLILLPLFRGIERDVRSDDCAVLFFRILKLTGPTCYKCKHSEIEWLIVVASTTIPAESPEQEELPCMTALSGKD